METHRGKFPGMIEIFPLFRYNKQVKESITICHFGGMNR